MLILCFSPLREPASLSMSTVTIRKRVKIIIALCAYGCARSTCPNRGCNAIRKAPHSFKQFCIHALITSCCFRAVISHFVQLILLKLVVVLMKCCLYIHMIHL